jgi:hypothetical protein
MRAWTDWRRCSGIGKAIRSRLRVRRGLVPADPRTEALSPRSKSNPRLELITVGFQLAAAMAALLWLLDLI